MVEPFDDVEAVVGENDGLRLYRQRDVLVLSMDENDVEQSSLGERSVTENPVEREPAVIDSEETPISQTSRTSREEEKSEVELVEP